MQQFSELLGEIYDTALCPDQWQSTLQSMAMAFGACFAGFGWEDTRVMAVGGSYGTLELADADRDSYRARYKTLIYSNPMRVPVLLTQEVDDVFTPGMLVPVEEYHASRYFKEYVQPMGWGDGLSTILSKSNGVVHFLAFARGKDDPPFEASDLALLKSLAPHIRRSYEIGKLLGRQQAKISALSQTFDGLAAAVFVLDDNARVTYRNKSAAGLLAQGKPFSIVHERLRCIVDSSSSANDRIFDRALLAALQGTYDTNHGSIVLDGIHGHQHVVHILPLATSKKSRMDSQSSVSLFVTRVGLETASPIETIASTFALTPREASILVGLMEVGEPAEVAARHGISLNTVKSHMKAIYAKTGVGRQGDLVKLVASFVSPARSPSTDNG